MHHNNSIGIICLPAEFLTTSLGECVNLSLPFLLQICIRGTVSKVLIEEERKSYLVQAALRRVGLTPACGSAHARDDNERYRYIYIINVTSRGRTKATVAKECTKSSAFVGNKKRLTE